MQNVYILFLFICLELEVPPIGLLKMSLLSPKPPDSVGKKIKAGQVQHLQAPFMVGVCLQWSHEKHSNPGLLPSPCLTFPTGCF